MKHCLLTHLTLLGLLGLTTNASARELPKVELQNYEPWEEATVHAFENILVQEGGRVKPIYTTSRFTLMQFSGKTTAKFETKDGEQHSLHHAEWMLDVLFRGEIAKQLPVFIVDDSEAVVQIGVSPKSRRDRYSYSELVAGRAKLAELSAQYSKKQQQFQENDKDEQYELGRIETMILTLGQNISSFEFLLGQFGFARKGEILVNGEILSPEFKEMAKTLDPVEMLTKMPEMTLDQLFQTVRQPVGDSEDERMFSDALRLFFFHANSGRGLDLFPPQEDANEDWRSSGDVMLEALEKKEVREWGTEQLGKIQAITNAQGESEEAFRNALQSFSDQQHQTAEDRGQGVRSEMEISLYRGQWFWRALYCFVIGFVVLAFSWFSPGTRFSKIMILLASLLALAGLVLDIYGITLRSIIRQRPPITNLYDTVIFITATAVLLGLIIEWFTRIGIGTLVAVVAGFAGMFLSVKYEAKEATDTITQLMAVLDTNFWLATHVTIINIGYAAGLVAAIFGVIYLAGRFICLLTGHQNKDLFKSLTRMNYGVICFCLFFSLVGTVLGGIWANYSWGRFWGWDPKENGALMICLWTLVILHGRMGGMLKDLGINMCSVILAGIVTFSWWGVNNLGVGLHSYGFTEGIWGALFSSWSILGIFLLMGVIIWFVERAKKADKKRAKSNKEAAASA
ncbi:cytochrome c biogenesis protein CcsA [Verrucomicrobiales bacterium]|nr:cytochrome c biogenesis protein CcsA [Verrucomicrobiales bacterium]